MNDHPVIEWNKLVDFAKTMWAKSMAAIVALVLGALLGIVYNQNDIIEDCKYTGSFRVHTQAFNCQRRM